MADSSAFPCILCWTTSSIPAMAFKSVCGALHSPAFWSKYNPQDPPQNPSSYPFRTCFPCVLSCCCLFFNAQKFKTKIISNSFPWAWEGMGHSPVDPNQSRRPSLRCVVTRHPLVRGARAGGDAGLMELFVSRLAFTIFQYANIRCECASEPRHSMDSAYAQRVVWLNVGHAGRDAYEWACAEEWGSGCPGGCRSCVPPSFLLRNRSCMAERASPRARVSDSAYAQRDVRSHGPTRWACRS
ncbi:hypothetical protein ACHAWF_003860 [Thalassiosira exigua]